MNKTKRGVNVDDFKIALMLREVYKDIRKELTNKIPVKHEIKLSGKLLNTLEVFLEKNNHSEDYEISEMIGQSFWSDFYELHPETERCCDCSFADAALPRRLRLAHP